MQLIVWTLCCMMHTCAVLHTAELTLQVSQQRQRSRLQHGTGLHVDTGQSS